jgi:hypothetical protein
MRAFGFAIILFAAPARAEPPVDHTAYVEGGVTGGFAFGPGLAVYGAGTVEGGARLNTGPLWLHGFVAEGVLAGIDGYGMTLSSNYLQLRGGLEARRCTGGRIVCVGGGIDAGYRRERLVAMDDGIRDDSIIVVPRATLDLGGGHLRFRTSFEITVNRSFTYSGSYGGGPGVTTGLAYAW